MNTDKYNPIKKENRNDYRISSTNSEPAEIAANNIGERGIFRKEDVPDPSVRSMPALDVANISKPGSPRGFDHWNDSAPVLRLSAYIRANRDAGIILCRRGDAPCLVFEPPLRRSDIGSMRWAIAEHAYDLAVDATRDLSILIRSGIISMDDMGTLDDIDAVGSSA